MLRVFRKSASRAFAGKLFLPVASWTRVFFNDANFLVAREQRKKKTKARRKRILRARDRNSRADEYTLREGDYRDSANRSRKRERKKESLRTRETLHLQSTKRINLLPPPIRGEYRASRRRQSEACDNFFFREFLLFGEG